MTAEIENHTKRISLGQGATNSGVAKASGIIKGIPLFGGIVGGFIDVFNTEEKFTTVNDPKVKNVKKTGVNTPKSKSIKIFKDKAQKEKLEKFRKEQLAK